MPIITHTLSHARYIERVLGPISSDLIEIGDIDNNWIYVGVIYGGTTGYEAQYDQRRASIVIREVYRPDTTSIFYPEPDFRADFPEFVRWAGRDYIDRLPFQHIVSAHRS